MAQMTAPESVLRAIVAAPYSPSRTRVLAALGLGPDGTPCSDPVRANALTELVTASIEPQPELLDEEDIPS